MTFDEWLEMGLSQGWIWPPQCATHDGTPLTEEEAAEWEDGGDPCILVTRINQP